MNGANTLQMLLDELELPAHRLLAHGEEKLFRALDEAACQFARLTGLLHGEVSLSTVAGQQAYDLPPDFIRPFLKNSRQRFTLRYTDLAGAVTWPVKVEYGPIFQGSGEAQAVAESWAIVKKGVGSTQLAGVTTEAAVRDANGSALVDSTASFVGAVQVRDAVRNETRGTRGLVLEVLSDTSVRCAMFPTGQGSWRQGDQYSLQPVAREQLLLAAPPLESGHTLLLPYVGLPAPVFSPSGFWVFSPEDLAAIVAEAAFLYATKRQGLKPQAYHHARFIEAVKQAKRDHALACLQGQSGGGE